MIEYTRVQEAKKSYVYVLTNEKRNAFHVDITGDMQRRMELHTNKPKGMVKDRKVNILVYLEKLDNMKLAIDRQKEIKRLDTSGKVDLIQQKNPEWVSLNQDYILP